MGRAWFGSLLIIATVCSGCGGGSASVDTPTTSTSDAATTTETTTTTTTATTVPPTTTTTEAQVRVVATAPDGQAVPDQVLSTAEQIYRAAQDQDLAALGALATASDFTYVFGDPPGDPVAYWSSDPVTTTSEMMRVLEESVATDGSVWWWPAAWLTDEAYFGYRIGIDNAGTWRFAVEGD